MYAAQTVCLTALLTSRHVATSYACCVDSKLPSLLAEPLARLGHPHLQWYSPGYSLRAADNEHAQAVGAAHRLPWSGYASV